MFWQYKNNNKDDDFIILDKENCVLLECMFYIVLH